MVAWATSRPVALADMCLGERDAAPDTERARLDFDLANGGVEWLKEARVVRGFIRVQRNTASPSATEISSAPTSLAVGGDGKRPSTIACRKSRAASSLLAALSAPGSCQLMLFLLEQGMQSDAIVVQRTRSARSGCPASAGRHLSGADSRRDLPAEAVRQELQVDDGCHGPGEPLEEPTLPPPAQQDDALGLRAGWPRLESAAAHLRRSCQTPLGAPPSSLLDRGMGRRRCRAGTCLWANAIVNTPPVPVGKHTFVQWTIPGVGKPTTLRPGGGKAYPSATACARTLRSTSTAESGS